MTDLRIRLETSHDFDGNDFWWSWTIYLECGESRETLAKSQDNLKFKTEEKAQDHGEAFLLISIKELFYR